MSAIKSKDKQSFTYTLTMSSGQLREASKAIELLMRLKLGQYDQLHWALLDIMDEDFCEKRDEAEFHLKAAFQALFRGKKSTEWKDHEWHVLYDLYQVIRKAIHDAEYPDSIGVDSYPPMCTAVEPMAKCEWMEGNVIG